MFRCRLAFVDRQWPKTFIDLTVTIPGSNLIPRHVIIIMDAHGKGPRCYPANHERPGGRPRGMLSLSLFQPPSTPMRRAVVGILDALPPARLAALSRLPSPWVP